jgi:uncharacterized membrane protein YgcG
LTLEALDAAYGTGEVVVERVNDSGGALGDSGRLLLSAEVARLEACFPQVWAVVHLSALGSAPALRQFGFWLLNRAALAGGAITRPNENGVLLLIDPQARLVGLTLGYQLEPWLPEPELERVLAAARRDFQRGQLAGGAVRVIRELTAALQRSLQSAPVAAAGDGGVPTGPLAGLRRLRGGGQQSGRTTPNPTSPHE